MTSIPTPALALVTDTPSRESASMEPLACGHACPSCSSRQFDGPVERLLTLDEVADVLTIGKTKTFALIKSGDLEAKFIGRRRVVASSELARFIASLPSERAA